MAYRLFVTVEVDGTISRSMLVNADSAPIPTGFAEVGDGPWWADLAGNGGDKWYWDDGPKPRQPLSIVVDRLVAKVGEVFKINLTSPVQRDVMINVGGQIAQIRVNEDTLNLRWREPGRVVVQVVDARYLPAAVTLEVVDGD